MILYVVSIASSDVLIVSVGRRKAQLIYLL